MDADLHKVGNVIAIACFVIAGGLAITAAIEDTRTHLLRNTYTLPIIAIGLAGLPVAGHLNDLGVGTVLTDMAIGTAWFAGPWLITHLIAPSQIGFGDIKLSAGLGLYLGWLEPSLGFAGFFATCLVFGVAFLASRSGIREQVPFGPSIVVGTAIATVLGLL